MIKNNVCLARDTCRICGSSELLPIVNLGEQCLGSLFVKGEVPPFLQQPYPLQLVRCSGQDSCGLVQLKHTIAPSVLYSHYGYQSGINERMRANLLDIVTKAEQLVELKNGDTVLDIGCNDGTLLCSYQTDGLDKLGLDPAVNIAEIAKGKGLNVINDFFSFQVYAQVRPNVKAKVVTSIAMFYDLEDPSKFVHDVASLLADDGVWIIEQSYLPFMLERNSFDTICHEHLEYYSLKQIEWMLERENLQVHKIEFNEINGGSFRLFIRSRKFGYVEQAEAIEISRVKGNEKALGLDTDAPYKVFNEASFKVCKDLKNLLVELKEAGKSVYIYGASTKGNTILQFCDIDQNLVKKAADRNPDKWGRFTLGTNIPIISEELARAENPDYFLVLPWHFFEVFKKREEAFIKRGGKFILPLPEVQILGQDDF
jgi:SAM-dependent methyltransferase